MFLNTADGLPRAHVPAVEKTEKRPGHQLVVQPQMKVAITPEVVSTCKLRPSNGLHMKSR